MKSLKNIERDLSLSFRQTEVLELISKGFTNKEIANLLIISPNTVKNHIATLLKQLEITNRTEAALLFKKCEEEYDGSPATLNSTTISILPFVRDKGVLNNFYPAFESQLVKRITGSEYFSVSFPDKGSFLNVEVATISTNSRYSISGSIEEIERQISISVVLESNQEQKTVWIETFRLAYDTSVVVKENIITKIAAQSIYTLLLYDGQQVFESKLPNRDFSNEQG